jgi:diguanylate cyclase (GGDEF)-like protein/PAS domain S-box-containing protein
MNAHSRLLLPLIGIAAIATVTVLGLVLTQGVGHDKTISIAVFLLAGLAMMACLGALPLALAQQNRLIQRELECRRAMAALDTLPDAIMHLDSTGRLLHLNPSARNMLGMNDSATAKISSTTLQLIDHDTRVSLLEDLFRQANSANRARLCGNPRLIAQNNLEYEVDGICLALRDPQGETTGYLLQLHDVTEEREWLRQQPDLWNRDPVTALPGRHFIESRLNQALQQRRADDMLMAYIHIPISGLQIIHSQAGPEATRVLLRHISTLLRSHVRDSDLIARVDDDAFAVLLNLCPPEVCQRITEAMTTSLRDFQFTWQGKDYSLHASLGVIQVPPFEGCLDELLAAAQAASQINS